MPLRRSDLAWNGNRALAGPTDLLPAGTCDVDVIVIRILLLV